MNIKSILLAIIILGASSALFAQKIQKEKLGRYSYIQLPSDITLVDMNTYKVEANGMHGDAYRRDAIAAQISLAGFEKTGQREEADFIVEVEEYPLRFGETERSTSKRKVKKDGVERTITEYTVHNSCRYKYVLHVFNQHGEELFTRQVAGEDKISGSKSGSSSRAYDSYNNAVKKYKSSAIRNKVSHLNRVVNNIYCFPPKGRDLIVGIVKPRKYDYDEVNGAYDKVVAGFEVVSQDENAIDAAASSLNEAIFVYEKALEESNLEKRKARINKNVTAMLYYNIGVCSFLMKDYQAAIDSFNKAIEVKSGIYDAKQFVKFCEELKERSEKNSV